MPLASSSPIECYIRPPALRPATLKTKNGRLLLFGRISSVQHALIGRGTCVLRARVIKGDTKKWGSESIAVMYSVTPGARISEGEMLSDIIECAEDVDAKADETDKTSIQRRLAEYFANTETAGQRIEYEKRTLQVSVMKKLYPIKDMDTADKLIPVIKDVFKCYKRLHETAGVIHRDISENNLMYWKKGDGTICGVLSDYDLSLMLARQDRGPSSKQRMGTRPFMALDLLEPPPSKHLYRHDLESLLYVIIVLMFRAQGENLIEDEKFKNFPALKDWFTLAPAQLLKEKRHFFSTNLPRAPPAFKELYLPISYMKEMFDDGNRARRRHELAMLSRDPAKPSFDESTLGGHVNFDKFQAILDSVQT